MVRREESFQKSCSCGESSDILFIESYSLSPLMGIGIWLSTVVPSPLVGEGTTVLNLTPMPLVGEGELVEGMQNHAACVGSSSLEISVGSDSPLITGSSIMTLATCFIEGSLYIISSKTCSKIERNPLAPDFRVMAF